MSAKKKQRDAWKNGGKQTFYGGIAWFALQGIFFWGIEHPVSRLPEEICKHIGYLIISRLLILLPVIVFCCTRRKKLKWWESALAVFCFLLPTESFFVWGERYSLLLYAALIPILIGCSVPCIRQKRMPYLLLALPFCFFMILRSRYFYHLTDVDFFKFYLPALLLSLLAVGCGFWLMKRPTPSGEKCPFWLALTVGLTCGILCMTVAQITTDSINYAFDFEVPETVEVTVADMRTDHHRRLPTDYELLVELGGENIWVEVPREVYRFCREGETVTLQLYGGALGMPYIKALK